MPVATLTNRDGRTGQGAWLRTPFSAVRKVGILPGIAGEILTQMTLFNKVSRI